MKKVPKRRPRTDPSAQAARGPAIPLPKRAADLVDRITAAEARAAAAQPVAETEDAFDYDQIADHTRRKIVVKASRFGNKPVKAKKTLEAEGKKAKKRKTTLIPRDVLVKSMAAGGKVEFGSSTVIVGDEFNSLVVGISLPSIALEYLYGQTVFPLGFLQVLSGKPGAGKTSYLLEVLRWHLRNNGIGCVADTEFKIPPGLVSGILGHEFDDPRLAVIYNKCFSAEDWQQRIVHYVDWAKSAMIGTQKEPGTGKTWPFALGLDSLDARAAEETQHKILKAGYASRSHPVEALNGKRWLQAFVPELDGWPFSLTVVNHLRYQKKDDGVGEDRKTPGGEFWKFQATQEIEVGTCKQRTATAEFNVRGVSLKSFKNSLEGDKRQIRTRILDWKETDPETGEPRSQVIWDWDWTTISFLSAVEPALQARLAERGIDLLVKQPMADVGCVANLRAVGMGKDEWEPFHVVGERLRKDAKASKLVRQALGIVTRRTMRGDFQRQQAAEAEKLP